MTMRNAFETLATESKQDDLNALVEALNTASASILAAVQAINDKVTACNTGAVTVSNSPTVSLDSTSLAALENISAAVSGTVSVSGSVEVSNDLGNAMPVAVSGTPTVSLDATSLSALESITAAVSGTVGVSGSVEITNDAGNAIPVSLAAVPAHSVSISNSPTVAIDTASLAALESVTISNQIAQPLTLAQLQGDDVKVSLDGESVAISNFPASQPVTGLDGSPVVTTQSPPPFMRVGFAEVGSGLQGLAASKLSVIQTGSGMAVNQSGGNLVITTGTTANSETVIRSVDTFSGSLLARAKTILSQRIANNTFRLELADLVGESLAFTCNSATSITVTFPTENPFAANSVGQFVRLSCISGAAGIPGRFAIAAVSGLTVNLTVASWPASGSGTLTMYGHNWIALEYSGTTATNALFDAQRRGWSSGNTTATINTTASPGHVAQLAYDVHTAGIADALVASNTGYQWTQRASRIENLPDVDVPLYLFIIAQNGSTAPASTTTWTMGFIQVEDQGRQKVRIASSDPVGSHAMPVQMLNFSTTTTANIGLCAPVLYADTTTVLAASAAYTGTSRDGGTTPSYQRFCARAYADQAGTLTIQDSTDNTTWRAVESIAVAAGETKTLNVPCLARYYRVVYTNGATLQGAFRLTSGYHRI